MEAKELFNNISNIQKQYLSDPAINQARFQMQTIFEVCAMPHIINPDGRVTYRFEPSYRKITYLRGLAAIKHQVQDRYPEMKEVVK